MLAKGSDEGKRPSLHDEGGDDDLVVWATLEDGPVTELEVLERNFLELEVGNLHVEGHNMEVREVCASSPHYEKKSEGGRRKEEKEIRASHTAAG